MYQLPLSAFSAITLHCRQHRYQVLSSSAPVINLAYTDCHGPFGRRHRRRGHSFCTTRDAVQHSCGHFPWDACLSALGGRCGSTTLVAARSYARRTSGCHHLSSGLPRPRKQVARFRYRVLYCIAEWTAGRISSRPYAQIILPPATRPPKHLRLQRIWVYDFPKAARLRQCRHFFCQKRHHPEGKPGNVPSSDSPVRQLNLKGSTFLQTDLPLLSI